jgi:hypothetical protein
MDRRERMLGIAEKLPKSAAEQAKPSAGPARRRIVALSTELLRSHR